MARSGDSTVSEDATAKAKTKQTMVLFMTDLLYAITLTTLQKWSRPASASGDGSFPRAFSTVYRLAILRNELDEGLQLDGQSLRVF